MSQVHTTWYQTPDTNNVVVSAINTVPVWFVIYALIPFPMAFCCIVNSFPVGLIDEFFTIILSYPVVDEKLWLIQKEILNNW